MLGKVLGHFHDLAHSRLGYNSVGDSHSGCVGISSGVSTTRGFGIVLTKLRILYYAFLFSRYCSYHSHAGSPDLIQLNADNGGTHGS